MKIWQTPPTGPIARQRRVKGSAAFSVDEDQGAAGRAASAGPAQPLMAPGSILSVQEVGDPLDGKAKRAREHGEAVLDELASLQLGMIDGLVSEPGLRRLAALVDEAGPEIGDENLRDALGEIEVRAAVELAKLEKHRS